MAMQRINVSFETSTGEDLGPFRVLAADKIATEGLCRKAGWDYADGPRAHSVMGFFAGKRAGAVPSTLGYKDFMADVADYSIEVTDPDKEGSDTPTEAGSDF